MSTVARVVRGQTLAGRSIWDGGAAGTQLPEPAPQLPKVCVSWKPDSQEKLGFEPRCYDVPIGILTARLNDCPRKCFYMIFLLEYSSPPAYCQHTYLIPTHSSVTNVKITCSGRPSSCRVLTNHEVGEKSRSAEQVCDLPGKFSS